MKAICLLIISVLILYSCEKHPLDKRAEAMPYILTFTSPVKNAIYYSEDSVRIQGTAIYTQNIHGYDILIKEVSDTTVYYFKHVHDHNDTLQISQAWKNTLTGSRNMEASITLYLDHDGNKGSGKVGFSLR